MSLIRYEPWSLHRELVNEFNKYFERNADGSSGATAEWAPSVDIEEYADKFVLHADVPGVDPKDIEITLENGVLTLSGSREPRSPNGGVEQKGIESRRIERFTGRFYRRFALPDTVDSDSVSAAGKNGVLEVVIPKRPQAQARKIAVKH